MYWPVPQIAEVSGRLTRRERAFARGSSLRPRGKPEAAPQRNHPKILRGDVFGEGRPKQRTCRKSRVLTVSERKPNSSAVSSMLMPSMVRATRTNRKSSGN